MNPILILGAKGTLGSQLCKLYPDAVGWDRDDLDVTGFESLREKVRGLGFAPGAIVNCVAFNDVDSAEERREQAYRLNSELVGNLARFTAELRIPLVHYSTNYVFDGAAGEYAENAEPSPLSVYGCSKLAGEAEAARYGAQYYVLRTAVLFGSKGASDLSKKSFIDIMLDLAEKRDTLQVVSDEINSVTYAPDLAAATCHVLATLPPPGIYHATNSGGASWYDLAVETFRLRGKCVNVVSVPSTHFARKALRPPKAILLNTKLPAMRPWQDALAEFLRSR
jgi:dTDP-4-dehydrorhamnose reductase